MKHWFSSSALSLVLTVGGCGSSDPVDIGDDDPVALGATLSDYAGSWEGYAEAHDFNDGSDAVRLQLDVDGNGVLEVGESAPLPPPDPERGYPPDARFSPMHAGTDALVSGFSYPIADAIVESRRIRAATASNELFREWCALMPPILDETHVEDPVYACIPNTGWSSIDDTCELIPEGEPPIPVDCAKLELCPRHCQCTADACGIAEDADDIRIDAALEAGGNGLEGTLRIGDLPVVVRMTRQ